MSTSEVSSKEREPEPVTGYGLDEWYSKLGIDSFTGALEHEVRHRLFMRYLYERYTPKQLANATEEERDEMMRPLRAMGEEHTLPQEMARAIVGVDILIDEIRGLREDMRKGARDIAGTIIGVGEDVITYGLLPIRDAVERHDTNMWVSDETIQALGREWLEERFGFLGKAKEKGPTEEEVDRALRESG